jgi:hypothetical protein
MADGSNWSNYSDYNKTVRAWFVALGIGGPVAMIAHPDLLHMLQRERVATCVVTAFFIAVACQILIAVINKTVSLQLAWADDDDVDKHKPPNAPSYRTTIAFRLADKVSDWWYLDVGADLISIVMFSYALYTMAHVGLAPAKP